MSKEPHDTPTASETPTAPETFANSSTNPLIPFGWLPGHWGLKGKTRERAQIEYEHTGYERDIKLANVDLDGKELNNALNELNKEYNKVTLLEYQREHANINLHGKALELELLEIDKLDCDIELTDSEYNKRLANINGESWVSILKLEPSKEQPNHGELELDWNDKFVEELREAGYEGTSDEAVVDLWLADLCRNIAMEQFSGVGDFDEQVGDGFINRNNLDDGKWEAR